MVLELERRTYGLKGHRSARNTLQHGGLHAVFVVENTVLTRPMTFRTRNRLGSDARVTPKSSVPDPPKVAWRRIDNPPLRTESSDLTSHAS